MMSKHNKIAIRKLSHRQAWARTFVGFICLWLVFGNIIQASASNYLTQNKISLDIAANTSIIGNPPPTLATNYNPVVNSPNNAANKPVNTASVENDTKTQISAAYGKLPMRFEANQGQTDEKVKFLSRGSGYTVFLTEEEMVLSFQPSPLLTKTNSSLNLKDAQKSKLKPSSNIPPAVVQMKLLGGNKTSKTVGLEALPTKSNYFIGNDPSQWHTDIPNYKRVELQEVYPGVDLAFYGTQNQLEYDFVVHPGADPHLIQLNYEGVDKIETNQQGELLLHTSRGVITQHTPTIYQENGSTKKPVTGRYLLKEGLTTSGKPIVGFEIESFDQTKALIIDPILIYSTYLGGSNSESEVTFAVDKGGNAFVTGATTSIDFPLLASYQGNQPDEDVFVSKLITDGTALAFSTYLGGSSFEHSFGVALDGIGNSYIGGQVSSNDFPVTQGALQSEKGHCFDYNGGGAFDFWDDAFVTKLNPSGNGLIYSTYIGGCGIDGVAALAVDSVGNAYITGESLPGPDFVGGFLWPNPPVLYPTTPGAIRTNVTSNVFVSKINITGTNLLYSTFIGNEQNDIPIAIAVNGAGNAYVVGQAHANFDVTAVSPPFGGVVDGFITKLSSTGTSLVFSRFLGGSEGDLVGGLVLDDLDNIYVTGNTSSSNFPTTTNVFQPNISASSNIDGFVAKLDALGNISFSTYLGITESAEGFSGIALDSQKNIFLAGTSYNATTQEKRGLLVELEITGTVVLDALYFAANSEISFSGLALDQDDSIYVGGQTGATNYITTTGVLQPINKGGSDSYITKLVLGEAPLGCQLENFPANPATGNFGKCFKDLAFPPPAGSSLAVEIVRAYNSKDNLSGLFGKGWRFTYDMQVLTGTETNLSASYGITGIIPAPLVKSKIVINPDGRRDRYVYTTGQNYKTPPGANATLKEIVGSLLYPRQLLLTTMDGVNYTFDADSGKLLEVRDNKGVTVNLVYNPVDGKLLSVNDNYGHNFIFTITTFSSFTGNVDRITAISDGTRTVNYTYDATGTYLKSVKDPRTFITTYNYDSSKGVMTQILDPNNHVVLENTYGSAHLLIGTGVDYDVIKQKTFPGNVPAGYSAYFDYKLIGNRTIFTNTRGFAANIKYKTPGYQLVELTDALGGKYEVARDKDYRPKVIKAPNGRVTNIDYYKFLRATNVSTQVTGRGSVTTNSSYNNLILTFNEPIQVKDANGKSTYYDYELLTGNLSKITDPLNNQTTFEYFSDGRLKKKTTVGGLVTSYTYNSLGLPETMKEEFSTIVGSGSNTSSVIYLTDYKYTTQGWLREQTGPYLLNGTIANTVLPAPVTYQYDLGGNLITTTNQLGQKASNGYDEIGNLISSTNFLGQQILYEYDWLRRVTKKTQKLSSEDLRTTYTYDEADNILSETLTSSVGGQAFITNYTYDELNRRKTAITPLISGGQAKTEYEYDGVGNVTKVTRYNSGAGNQVTIYKYDELNSVTEITDAEGYKQSNTYDKNGNLTEEKQVISSSPFQEVIWTTTYDDINRPLTRKVNTGSEDLTTTYSYNDTQNLTTITDPFGRVTTLKNDAAGRTIINTLSPAQPSSDAVQTTYNYYDANNLLLRTIDPSSYQTDFNYDPIFRPIATTRYTGTGNNGVALTTSTAYLDQAQPKITTTGPNNYKVETLSDQAGRLLESKLYSGTTPLTHSYTYDAQGNRLFITDSSLHVTQFKYDNTGWLLEVSELMSLTGGINTTKYTYDLVGNRIQTEDAKQHLSYADYNRLNQMIRERDALNNIWEMGYDGLGRLATYKDAKSQITNYSYDKASRLLNVSTAGLSVSYSYNKGGNPLTMLDPSGNTNYIYDGFNRLKEVTNVQGTVKYTYDNSNRRTSLIFGNPNKTVAYQYDGLNRPITITNWLGEQLGYSYNQAQLSQISYPNGITATFSFDGAGHLNSITQTKGVNTIFSALYTVDSRGNRTSATELLNNTSRTISYTYDELSRLTREVRQVGTSTAVTSTYGYDLVGNRTSLTSILPPNTKSGGALTLATTYNYDNANKLSSSTLSSNGTQSNSKNYSYDNNGSLISELNNAAGGETTAYSYDSRNRLTGWQRQRGGQGITTAAFTYDGNDNRLTMTYGGKTTGYLQDASGLAVVLQENVTGQATGYFMYALGSTSPLFTTDASGTKLWYHSDGQQSVRALTDANGSIVNNYSYSAFGLNDGASDKVPNTHRFAGEQLDPTGLYFNRNRYYNPELGRFISRDSYMGEMAMPLSQNRYIYGMSNPLKYNDPSGFMPQDNDAIKPFEEAPQDKEAEQNLNNQPSVAASQGEANLSLTELTEALASVGEVVSADEIRESLERQLEKFVTLSSKMGEYQDILLENIEQLANHELAVFFDENGELILFKIGFDGQVEFSDEELKIVQGTYSIHTHPVRGEKYLGGNISDDDLAFAATQQLIELGVVTKDQITGENIKYVVRPLSIWPNSNTLREGLNSTLTELVREKYSKEERKTIRESVDQTFKRNVLITLQDDVMARMAQKFNLLYSKRVW